MHIAVVARLPYVRLKRRKLAENVHNPVKLKQCVCKWDCGQQVVYTVTKSFSELCTQQLRKILKPLFSVVELQKALRYGNPHIEIAL